MKRKNYAGSVVALLALASCGAAQAQYPARPVRLIVPFAAGSVNDTVARFVQPQLSVALGQQVVIDNRAGAAGNLGAEVAAKSAPDGYTVVMGNLAHAISVSLYGKLGYDLVKDFAPVSSLAAGSFMLVVHPSLPVKSARELIAFARKRPGELNSATAGAAIRLAAKLFESMAGIRMTEVAYKSTPQAVTALISGEASVGMPPASSVVAHAQSGKLRALGVSSIRRSAVAPGVPTLAESGVPGYDVTTWYGLMVPAGTPREIISRLHDAADTALANSEVRKRFATTDLEPRSSTPEQFGTLVRAEIAKWAKVVKESGMQTE